MILQSSSLNTGTDDSRSRHLAAAKHLGLPSPRQAIEMSETKEMLSALTTPAERPPIVSSYNSAASRGRDGTVSSSSSGRVVLVQRTDRILHRLVSVPLGYGCKAGWWVRGSVGLMTGAAAGLMGGTLYQLLWILNLRDEERR